jgi:ion channel-forming bestrophin family protein
MASSVSPPEPLRVVFWKDVFSWQGSVTPLVLPRVIASGVYGLSVATAHHLLGWDQLGAVPAQFTAAILVLLLVLRTNASYDRWWEARKLWGGIVNQSRNLAVAALAYGPDDAAWRARFVRWSAAFCHAARASLRGERALPELPALLQDEDAARRVLQASHMPSFVTSRLAGLLREALDRGQLHANAFLGLERERALLIDHIGGCERILKTPLPYIHTVKLRRFIVIYLLWLPLAAVGDLIWVPALVTALVSYPLLAIDRIAAELENPFSTSHLSHLPLTDICATIEKNLLAMLESEPLDDAASNGGMRAMLQSP